MASLLGSLAAPVRNGVPVPAGRGGRYDLSPLAMGGTPDEALMRAYGKNGTAYSNISLLARSVAKPRWNLYRKPKRGGARFATSDQGSDEREQVLAHQALNVFYRPAVVTADGQPVTIFSRFKLLELSQIWMDSTGKSHWVVDWAGNIPVGLWPVRPDRMTPVPDRVNFLKGWVYTAPDGMEKVPLRPQDVIYNNYADPLDVYGGLGPLASVLTTIDSAQYSDEHNRNFFLNSAEPGGVITSDYEISDEEYDKLANRWREGHRGVSRAHRIAILENGQKWTPAGIHARDGDFVNLRNLSRDLIREALAMHKIMTGVSDDVNRANAQTGEEIFAAWQVAPRLERWRDVLNYQFLPLFGKAGQDVEFDFVYPMPRNREQDMAELIAKTAAAATLADAGFDAHAALQVVGLPDMPWSAPAMPAKPAEKEGARATVAARVNLPEIRDHAMWNVLEGAR